MKKLISSLSSIYYKIVITAFLTALIIVLYQFAQNGRFVYVDKGFVIDTYSGDLIYKN